MYRIRDKWPILTEFNGKILIFIIGEITKIIITTEEPRTHLIEILPFEKTDDYLRLISFIFFTLK